MSCLSFAVQPKQSLADSGCNNVAHGRFAISNFGRSIKSKLANPAKNVLRQWFSYRRRDRSRPIIGDRRPPSPLDKIQPDHWLAEYTSDLIDLLNVLGRLVALEPAQADLLERVCAGALISVETLRAAGAIPPARDGEAD